MSRRSAAIVEEFDDDTDIPLPSKPLAHTGSRGALLQSIEDDDDGNDHSDDGEDLDFSGDNTESLLTLRQSQRPKPTASASNPATPSHLQQQFENKNMVTDLTPYKKYVLCILFLS